MSWQDLDFKPAEKHFFCFRVLLHIHPQKGSYDYLQFFLDFINTVIEYMIMAASEGEL